MEEVLYRCPVCKKFIRPGEVTTQREGWVYHTSCLVDSLRKPRLNIWLMETIQRKKRTTLPELMREMFLAKRWGAHMGILEFFLRNLEASGMIKRDGEQVIWVGEEKKEAEKTPREEAPKEKKSGPKVKPPEVLV